MKTQTDSSTLVRRPAWTASKVEEVIAALWAIAGLCAWIAGIGWLGWVLLIKAGLDIVSAIVLAVVEIRAKPARPREETLRSSDGVGELERRKKAAFERWMDAIERRLTAQEEEDAARKEYSAADDAYFKAASSPTVAS